VHKKVLLVGITVVLLSLGLSGCTGDQTTENGNGALDSRLFGTWKFTHGVIEQTYTFFANGTFLFSDVEIGTYSTENGNLLFTYKETGFTLTTQYSFDDAYTLNITDENGQTMTYTKQ